MLVALFLLVVPTIFAQETFGLSDEDFALLSAAPAVTFASDSFAFEFTANFSVGGMGSEETSASISGSGVFGGSEDNPLFQLILNGEAILEGETQPLSGEIRIVGNTLYWSGFDNGAGWQGQTLESLASEFGDLAGMMGGGDLPVDPESLASGDLSGLAGMEGMSEAMAALASLDPSEFITMTRDDANGLAHFTVDLSISDLLSSPAVISMMGMAGGMEGMEMSEQEMQSMAMGMAMLFADASATFEEYVDPATSLLQRAVLDINVPLSAMTGDASAGIALNFDISLSGFGEPVTVEAPEGATMVPAGN